MRFESRTWARWLATFIGFPLAGLAARAVAGNIDDLRSSLIGGLAAGAVLGAVQAIAVRNASRPEAWIAASAIGVASGLATGASIVDYHTDTTSLVVMGAITGAGLGMAQASVLAAGLRRRVLWAVATPGLWALGWFITAQVIVDADRQHANFGASGALVVTALGGLLLAASPRRADDHAPSSVPASHRVG